MPCASGPFLIRRSGVRRVRLCVHLDLLGARGTLHRDLAWLRRLAHRDHDAQHAVLVARRDAVRVDALPEVELTQEGAGAALTGEPLHALLAARRALRPDR